MGRGSPLLAKERLGLHRSLKVDRQPERGWVPQRDLDAVECLFSRLRFLMPNRRQRLF